MHFHSQKWSERTFFIRNSYESDRLWSQSPPFSLYVNWLISPEIKYLKRNMFFTKKIVIMHICICVFRSLPKKIIYIRRPYFHSHSKNKSNLIPRKRLIILCSLCGIGCSYHMELIEIFVFRVHCCRWFTLKQQNSIFEHYHTPSGTIFSMHK